MLDAQILLGSGLAIALVLWAAADTIATPLTPSLETNQLGHWLSYFAAAAVLGAFGWHVVRRITAGWADIAVWLAVAVIAFVACSVDRFDTARQWLSYHTLTAGWLAIGAIATALIAFLAGTKPGLVASGRREPPDSEPTGRFNAIGELTLPARPPGASWLPAIGPHHLSSALVAGLLVLLAVRGSTTDPAGPWWSLAASLVPLAMTTALGLVRRSQPYAYASVLVAGLSMILFWVAPAAHPWYRLLFDDTPAAIELTLLAMILAAGFWLWREADTQQREIASFDPRFLGPRVHAAVILCLLPLYYLLRLVMAFVGDAVLRFEGYEIAATVTIVAWGVLLFGTLWDRRAWFSLPMLYLWGLAAWAGIVGLVQALLPTADERLAVLLLALALQIAASGQLWSYGANLSLLGSRLGVSDPIGGLQRTEWWLPPVNLLFAGVLCFAQLFLVLSLARVEIRVLAALSPAIAAWGVLCLAQEKRRDALQLTALLMAGLAAIYLGWAQLDPREAPQTWGLTRAFRLLMVLAAVTFLYGLVLPRWLLTAGSWNAAVRRAGHVAGASAIATFIGVLVLEAMLFTPGVDAPIDGVQVAAIAVVLVGLIAGLLSLALLPGRDPLALTETGRQWYVYAAEATAALLFAHLYICRPTWFDTVLRPYWPLIIMGIAFLGVGASELCHRWKIRVLAEPLEKTGGLLPLLPVLGMWVISATNTDYALLLLVVGILYLVLSFTRKSWAALVAAAVAGNGALWALLHREGFDITANPQLWLIPPALSVLAAAQVNKHRLDANTLTAIRYLATIVIYVSSTSEIFIRGVGETLWPPMILTGLAVAGAMLGIMLRIRAFLYLGTSFTLLGLITMVWHAARAIEHVWPWWAFGIGLGIAILVLFGVFEKKRAEMLLLISRLRQWEQ